MRSRVFVLYVLVLVLAAPLFASDKGAVTAGEPVGVIQFEGQALEVFSWSWGATQPPSSIGSGGGTGKVQLQDFHFTKKVDKSSPRLFQACANGQHLPTVSFAAKKKGDKQNYMIVTMSDVLVSSYRTGGSSGDDLPVETVSLTYAKIEFQVP